MLLGCVGGVRSACIAAGGGVCIWEAGKGGGESGNEWVFLVVEVS
jgi:hypothetical protein